MKKIISLVLTALMVCNLGLTVAVYAAEPAALPDASQTESVPAEQAEPEESEQAPAGEPAGPETPEEPAQEPAGESAESETPEEPAQEASVEPAEPETPVEPAGESVVPETPEEPAQAPTDEPAEPETPEEPAGAQGVAPYSMSYVYAKLTTDEPNIDALGLKKGDSLSGTVCFFSDYAGETPVDITEALTTQIYDFYGYIELPEGESLTDYIDAVYDEKTNQLTLTVKKDIALKNNRMTARIDVSIQSTDSYSFSSMSVALGAAEWNSSGSAYWNDIVSDDGCDSELSQYEQSGRIYGWKAVLGHTPVSVSASLWKNRNNTDAEKSDIPVTAVYNTEEDLINLKIDPARLPSLQELQNNSWSIALTVTLDNGKTVLAYQTMYRSSISTSVQPEEASVLPQVIPAAKGETASLILTKGGYVNGTWMYTPLTCEEPVTVTADSIYNAALPEGKTAADYVSAVFDEKTARLTLTVLEDIPLAEGRETCTVNLKFSDSWKLWNNVSTSVEIGKKTLNIYYKKDPGFYTLQTGSFVCTPTQNYNGPTLSSLGIDYTIRFVSWQGSEERVLTDAEAEKYFAAEKQADGSTKITVREVPPLFADGEQISYGYRAELNDPRYRNNNRESFSAPSFTGRLALDGKRAYTVPKAQGRYTYALSALNGSGEAVPFTAAALARTYVQLADGTSLSNDRYEVTFDASGKTVTVEWKENVPSDGTLSLTLYTDIGTVNASLSVGTQKIRFSTYSMTAGTDAEPTVYLGDSYDVKIPASALQDSGFALEVQENNVWVPADESEILALSVKNGVLSAAFKNNAFSRVSARVRYQDDTYFSDWAQFTVSAAPSQSGIRTVSASLVHTETGGSSFVGAPGTTQVYRVIAEGRNITAVCGDAVEGFTFYSNFEQLDEYVTLEYNKNEGLLSLHWKKKLPLFNADKTVPYTYTLYSVMKEGADVSVGPISLFGDSSYLYVHDTLVPGGSVLAIPSKPVAFDDGIRIYSTDSAVDTSWFTARAEGTDGIRITASENCPTGSYYVFLRATTDGGARAWMQNVTLRVESGDAATFNFTVTMPSGAALSTSYYNANMSSSLTVGSPWSEFALANETFTDFAIEGLTFGTLTKLENGNLRVEWAPNDTGKTRSETLTLKATRADGTVCSRALPVTQQAAGSGLSFRVNDSDAMPIGSGTVWVLGKTYTVTPLLGGREFGTPGGNTLRYVFTENDSPFSVSLCEDGRSFTLTPLREDSSYSYRTISLTYEDADGELRTVSANWYGTVKNVSRAKFFSAASGGPADRVTLGEYRKSAGLTVDVPKEDVKSIEFGSTAGKSVTWKQDPDDPRKVTVYTDGPFSYQSYFYANITFNDGTQTAAFIELSWQSPSTTSTLPNGYRLAFGTKREDGTLQSWGGSSFTTSGSGEPWTYKLSVFFARGYSDEAVYKESMPDLVKSIKVTSLTDGLTVTRQGLENGMYFFECIIPTSPCGEYILQAAATLQDGRVYTSTYEISVINPPERTALTVKNTDELKAALSSALLVPGTTINLASGEYTGDFRVDVPNVTLAGAAYPSVDLEKGAVTGYTGWNQANGTWMSVEPSVIRGTLTAAENSANVTNISFAGGGTGIAADRVNYAYNCVFTNYETAVVLSNHTSSNSLLYNVFENNKTAVRMTERMWSTYVSDNTFLRNDTALAVDEDCQVNGAYSPDAGCVLANSTVTRNLFYMKPGQKAAVNNNIGGVRLNLAYNYFRTEDASGKTVSVAPEAEMFTGVGLYFPYYNTPLMDKVSIGMVDDHVIPETDISDITLTAALGSSNTNTADSALELESDIFDQLKASEKANKLDIHIKSTSGETDATWSFKKEDLKDDFEGESINLGIAFTFTDFEHDMTNNIVRKSTEDGSTLDNIAYQAMCFSHSGDLPGTATVKVRMNESLIAYYTQHDNSLKDFKVYYLNTNTGMLELMKTPLEVFVESGIYYYTMQVDHCSSYIVTTETLKTDVLGIEKILAAVGSGYSIDGAFLTGLVPSTKLADLLKELIGAGIVAKNARGEVLSGDALVGTGCTLGLGADGAVSQLCVVMKGDVNGDGNVTMDDVIKIRQNILKLISLSDAENRAAQVKSASGQPGLDDVNTVRQYLLHVVSTL